MTDEEIGQLAGTYRLLAEEWDEQQGDSQRANPLFEKNHEIAKELRRSEPGRQAIEALLTHPQTGVRLLAATDVLRWDPEAAAPVLERIKAGPGLHAVSAKWTLKSFHEGRLDLDW